MEELILTLELTINQPLLDLLEAWRTIVEVGQVPDIILDLLIEELDTVIVESLISDEETL